MTASIIERAAKNSSHLYNYMDFHNKGTKRKYEAEIKTLLSLYSQNICIVVLSETSPMNFQETSGE